MKHTQDFACPECGRIVRAYKTREEPPLRDGYYYPTAHEAVLERQGYTWVSPYKHNAPGEASEAGTCFGYLNRYYVGDMELA